MRLKERSSLNSQHILDHREPIVHHLNSVFDTLNLGDSLRNASSADNSTLVEKQNVTGLPSQRTVMPGRRRKGSPSGRDYERNKKAAKSSSKRGIQSEFSTKVCTTWFREYTKKDEGFMGPEGMEKFCEDIGVEPENVVMLALAWKLEAERMGFFKLTEWMKGMTSLQCDSISKLQDSLDNLRSLLNNPVSFKSIFRFAFDFAKEENQRSLDKDTAKQMLTLLLGGLWPLQSSFNQFLEQSTRYQVMNKDQWCNVLEFSRSISNDLSNYDEDGAWPVMMDEFVEWYKENHAAGPSSSRS